MRLVVAGRIPRIKRKSLAGQFVLVLIGLQMMFFTSFVAMELPTGTGQNLLNTGRHTLSTAMKLVPKPVQEKVKSTHPEWFKETKPLRTSLYTPMAPMAVFLGYVLGRTIGPISVFLFLCLGFLGPLFGINPLAGGGGLDYYTQPSFGYLLGLMFGTLFVGWITEERRNSFAQVVALVGGLLSIHLVGLVYLLGSCLVLTIVQGVNNGPLWLPWVFEEARNLSWYPLPYDFLFSFILIGLGFPFRYLVNLLTAPDMALKSRNDRLAQQHMEELMG
ncbi:MAG TPA: biotin transporter BioY [Oculatellaceae cyanobacterium]